MTALAVRAVIDARRRTAAFGLLFGLMAWVQPFSYARAYPTVADRLAFAHSFGGNLAVRLFYGAPRGLLTVGGYTAWRLGGTAVLVIAVWAIVAVSGLTRGEEDAGRAELVLALPVGRIALGLGAAGALTIDGAVLCGGMLAGLLAGGLAVAGSLLLVAAIVVQIGLWGSVAALTAQLTGSRGHAMRAALALFAAAFAVRVIADTVDGASGLRWATPLGWAEQVRPFTGGRPLLLALPLLATASILAAGAMAGRGRDIGLGRLSEIRIRRHEARPRTIGSVGGLAAQLGLGTTLAWSAGVAAYGVLVGVIAPSVSSAGIPASVRRSLRDLGNASVATPRGYIGFAFIFFVLLAALLAASQISALRHEELGARLSVVLTGAMPRQRWLAERLAVSTLTVTGVAVAAAAALWTGANLAGVDVGVGAMALAAANAVAVGVLFLGLGATVYGAWPRAAAAVSYGAVTIAFLWQLFGSLLGLPGWLARATPFAHLGLTPAQPFRAGPVVAMATIGMGAALLAAVLLSRRDVLDGE